MNRGLWLGKAHRALLDRLTHYVHILEMNGDSYRLKGSRHSAATLAPASDRTAAD